jgi:hypothetical protein
MKYQVIVGNVGTTLDTDSFRDARKEWLDWKRKSKDGVGRGAYEEVTLMEDKEPKKGYEFKCAKRFPSQCVLRSTLFLLKKDIADDYRCQDDDEGDRPGMTVTIGADGRSHSSWAYQTGDNSFTGNAYGYAYWGVVSLYRDSNCLELAKDIIDQLNEY